MIVQKNTNNEIATYLVFDENIKTKVFDGVTVNEVPTQVFSGTLENASSILEAMKQQALYYSNEVNRKQAIFDAISSA